MPTYETRKQPNGSILIRVVVGYEGFTPIRRSKTFPASTPKRELDQWAMKTKVEHADTPKRGGKVSTPDGIIRAWLANAEGRVALRTYETYEATARRYTLGKLRRFDREELARLFAGLNRKGLAPKTVETVRTHLKMAVNFAMDEGLIEAAPRFPKAYGNTRAKVVKVLSLDEQDRLRRYLREHGELELETLLTTGMRIGELEALEPRHVGDNTVAVMQSRAERWGSREVKQPKSRHGYRTISVNPPLGGLLSKRAEQRKADGERWLFSVGRSGLAKRLKKACEALEFEPLNLHGLRHSHCVWLLSQSEVNIEAIRERMGHHTSAFTLSTYSHLVVGADKGLREAVTNLYTFEKTRRPESAKRPKNGN